MANLLLDWINEELRLSRRVNHIEKDFSSGMLLAEVLYKLGKLQSLDEFKDSDKTEDMVHNFELMAKTLEEAGVRLNNQLVLNILTETRGEASKVGLI